MKNNDDFFGTMFDFDGDGHTDITETYMAYRMMNDDDDSFTPRRAPSGSSRCYNSDFAYHRLVLWRMQQTIQQQAVFVLFVQLVKNTQLLIFLSKGNRIICCSAYYKKEYIQILFLKIKVE